MGCDNGGATSAVAMSYVLVKGRIKVLFFWGITWNKTMIVIIMFSPNTQLFGVPQRHHGPSLADAAQLNSGNWRCGW